MILRNSLVYLSVNIVNKGVPFLLLPLLTNYLTPSEYGLIALFQISITVFQSVFGLSLNVHVVRTYFKLDSDSFATYFFSVYFALFVSCLFGLLASLLLVSEFQEYIGLDERWLYAMPLISAMSMSNLIYLTLLRTKENVRSYAAWELSITAFNLLLSIFLIVLFGFGWEGRALGISTPLFLFGFFSLIKLLREGGISPKLKPSQLKEILSISIPLIPHAFCMIVISSVDKFIIKHFSGQDEVGIYAVGFQFGLVVMLVADSCMKAWQPWFFKKINEVSRDSLNTLIKYEAVYLSCLLLFAVIYSLIAVELLPYIIDLKFEASKDVVFVISLSYFMFGLYQVYFLYVVYSGKTRSMVLVTPLCAIINVVLNIFLIPRLGVYGAGVSLLFSYSLLALIVYLKARSIRGQLVKHQKVM